MTDTWYIQDLFDKAAAGGFEAVVPAGTYICGTLFLRNNLTVRLEKGAYIIGSMDFDDYSDDVNLFIDAVGGERGKALIYGEGVENFRIYGDGIINGRGGLFKDDHPGAASRPFLVRIKDCRNVSFEGITLQDGAAWNFHIMNCDNVTVKGITIKSHVNANNDGIDIDASRDCLIENCFIDTGDDAICFKTTVDRPCRNITVRGCTLSSNWAAIKIGTESVGDFENINISDVFIYDTNGCAIKIVPVDGANVRNVKIENIRFENSTGPIFIANGNRLRQYHQGNFRTEPGQIENVTIKNLSSDCINAVGTTYQGEDWGNAKSCIVVSGTPDKPVKNLYLSDFTVKMAGGCNVYEMHEIPEMGKRYPEFHNFGVLPAWGVYTRHTDGLVTENISLELKDDDVREMEYHD